LPGAPHVDAETVRWPILLVMAMTGCLGLPRQSEDDHALSLAADCLDREDTAGAVTHLSSHLDRHPDQPVIRALLAAQYASLGQWADAAREYDAAIGELMEDPDASRDQLIQCHTKRVKVAAEMDDERIEARHRGIALLLIAGKVESPDRALLSEALGHLKSACDGDRTDAVAHLYLGDCLMKLGQSSAARAAYAVGKNAPPGAVPSRLVPPEGW
jgi:Tfp pilus assembly protein PilF